LESFASRNVLPYICKKKVSASIQEARTLNLSVYIVYYMESILLANPSEGKFSTNICSYTMSFRNFGVVVALEMIHRQYLFSIFGASVIS
jgi:L-ribulose-5-phosphate 3-epimerase UlaE